MPGEVKVVPISAAHADSFRECLDTVAREKRYIAMTEAPPLGSVTAFVLGNVQSDAPQFVALDGERVVGWADVAPLFAQAVSHCGRLGMGVLPGYRGRGIGARLLEACLAKARAKGITRVELDARADNKAALRLYERAGFRREALKRNAMRFDGVYHDAVQMSLILDGGGGGPAGGGANPRQEPKK
jgi:ribosomal protein S18 acetylase RimI-like enzyme